MMIIILSIIAGLILICAVLVGVICALVKEIRRWRIKCMYLETEMKRSDREMLQ